MILLLNTRLCIQNKSQKTIKKKMFSKKSLKLPNVYSGDVDFENFLINYIFFYSKDHCPGHQLFIIALRNPYKILFFLSEITELISLVVQSSDNSNTLWQSFWVQATKVLITWTHYDSPFEFKLPKFHCISNRLVQVNKSKRLPWVYTTQLVIYQFFGGS